MLLASCVSVGILGSWSESVNITDDHCVPPFTDAIRLAEDLSLEMTMLLAPACLFTQSFDGPKNWSRHHTYPSHSS
jgi:hypothetical protein